WLCSEVVMQTIKNTLDSTLDAPYQNCQLKNVTHKQISISLENILLNDLNF
ncbi:25951_t:CDS:1, partial [Dentiscutata erythropus]